MTDILNIRGLDVDPVRTTESDEAIVIGIKRRPDGIAVCPSCIAMALSPNGARVVEYADLPVRGKAVVLSWDRQRFLCGRCKKAAPDTHHQLHDEFMMTRRLYDWIGTRSLTHTFAAISNDIRLDERTVRRVFQHWSDTKVKELRFETPRILGMDEVHLLHAARGILTNIEQRTMIDLLPGRTFQMMSRRVAQMPDRDRVQVLAIDMWAPYRRVAETLLPNARVVVDKWHVTKYADAGMEHVRKSHRATLPPAMRRRLVKDRFLLLSRGHRLKPEQHLIMETWLNHFPDLALAYAAKEAFYRIYDCQTRKEAETMYGEWRDSLTPAMEVAFKDLLSATTNWRNEIFNYFDVRVTNAYTEALNGLVKIANRNGRGYSFDVLRARMLLNHAAAKADKPAPPKYMATFEMGDAYSMMTRRPKHYGIDLATITRLMESDHFWVTSTGFAG